MGVIGCSSVVGATKRKINIIASKLAITTYWNDFE
jgi:hypothetical protein